MKAYKVYRLSNGTLTTDPSDYGSGEYDYVGEFEADAHCDFLHNMMRINEQEGCCDPELTKLAEQVNKDGL
jgi:hypothetical protein